MLHFVWLSRSIVTQFRGFVTVPLVSKFVCCSLSQWITNGLVSPELSCESPKTWECVAWTQDHRCVTDMMPVCVFVWMSQLPASTDVQEWEWGSYYECFSWIPLEDNYLIAQGCILCVITIFTMYLHKTTAKLQASDHPIFTCNQSKRQWARSQPHVMS